MLDSQVIFVVVSNVGQVRSLYIAPVHLVVWMRTWLYAVVDLCRNILHILAAAWLDAQRSWDGVQLNRTVRTPLWTVLRTGHCNIQYNNLSFCICYEYICMYKIKTLKSHGVIKQDLTLIAPCVGCTCESVLDPWDVPISPVVSHRWVWDGGSVRRCCGGGWTTSSLPRSTNRWVVFNFFPDTSNLTYLIYIFDLIYSLFLCY